MAAPAAAATVKTSKKQQQAKQCTLKPIGPKHPLGETEAAAEASSAKRTRVRDTGALRWMNPLAGTRLAPLFSDPRAGEENMILNGSFRITRRGVAPLDKPLGRFQTETDVHGQQTDFVFAVEYRMTTDEENALFPFPSEKALDRNPSLMDDFDEEVVGGREISYYKLIEFSSEEEILRYQGEDDKHGHHMYSVPHDKPLVRTSKLGYEFERSDMTHVAIYTEMLQICIEICQAFDNLTRQIARALGVNLSVHDERLLAQFEQRHRTLEQAKRAGKCVPCPVCACNDYPNCTNGDDTCDICVDSTSGKHYDNFCPAQKQPEMLFGADKRPAPTGLGPWPAATPEAIAAAKAAATAPPPPPPPAAAASSSSATAAAVAAATGHAIPTEQEIAKAKKLWDTASAKLNSRLAEATAPLTNAEFKRLSNRASKLHKHYLRMNAERGLDRVLGEIRLAQELATKLSLDKNSSGELRVRAEETLAGLQLEREQLEQTIRMFADDV
jgi:hypothetical protein